MTIRAPEPRVLTIEGRRTLVIDRKPPVPSTLKVLLEGGRDEVRTWHPLRVTIRRPLRIYGSRSACLDQDHRLADWIEGFHTGSDGIARHLRLLACQDCGAVCVRDRSVDHLDGLPASSLPRRRRDHVLAWYSGSRPANRVFMPMPRTRGTTQ